MDITVKNLQKKIPVHPPKIIQAARIALKALRIDPVGLSIVLMGQQRMRRINREYLGHDYVTDVITFNHGEILICPSVAQANAKKYKTSTDKEILLYVVHGILHLAGYDDHSDKDIQRMRAKESELMRLV